MVPLAAQGDVELIPPKPRSCNSSRCGLDTSKAAVLKTDSLPCSLDPSLPSREKTAFTKRYRRRLRCLIVDSVIVAA
eukprot:6005286-Amphidinium_carterae.1